MMRLAHAVVACLAGAGLALFGATRVWTVQVTPRPGLPDLRAPATGADAQPWLIALALIALAGAGAMLATRGVVRRGLGGLLALVGAGIAVAAVAGRAGTDAGAAGAGAAIWPIACVLGGALVALAGLGAARHGHRWPVMGARYERRPVPGPSGGPGGGSGPSPFTGPTPGSRSGAAKSAASAAAGSESGAAAGSGAGAAAGPAAGGAAGPGAGIAARSETGSDSGPGGATVSGRAGETPVDTRAVWDALDRGDDPTAR
jgi:uncharacterized membrane protein (TIGR02234 family)